MRSLRLLVLACLGCAPPQAAHELRLEGSALGTAWSVTLVTQAVEEPGGVRGRVDAVLERVDREMSTWREDSELSRFNRGVESDPFPFSAEVRRVVAAALDLARETGGAFDPTVGPLVRLFGFGSGAHSGVASEQELMSARKRVGWQQLLWDAEGRLARRSPGVELDLSAIAKGYAVDAIVADLARDRPLGLLVDLGGEVRALGARTDGEPWRVGIENPVAPGSKLEAVLALTGAALATSGDYRQTRVVAGERYTHVIDPRSGRPVSNGVASASVVAPTCAEADAVATALMVLGPETALAWVEERPWLEALLVIRDGDRVAERRASSGWARWLASE